MLRLNTTGIVLAKKTLKAFVPEALDHAMKCNSSHYIMQDGRLRMVTKWRRFQIEWSTWPDRLALAGSGPSHEQMRPIDTADGLSKLPLRTSSFRLRQGRQPQFRCPGSHCKLVSNPRMQIAVLKWKRRRSLTRLHPFGRSLVHCASTFRRDDHEWRPTDFLHAPRPAPP